MLRILAAADMSFFTPEAVSWFPPYFVGALPAETFSGFTADQISNIQAQFFYSNPNYPDAGVQPEQISQITLDAMSGITSQQISVLGQSPDLMGAFSPEQVSYLDAPDSGGGVLDYSLMQNFMTYIAYHPEHVEDFSAADMSFFTPEAVSWFPPYFVGALPAETFSGFTADQISNIQAQFFYSNPNYPDAGVQPEQISQITLDAMSGITSQQISVLGQSPDLMGAFSPEQVSYLDAPDSGGGVLDYSLMQNFMTYIAYHPEHVEDFSAADMSHFTPEAVSWFPPYFVGALPAETFSGFTADQISNIQAQFFYSNPNYPDAGVQPEQISQITLDAMAGLNLAQATVLAENDELLTALSEDQILSLQPDCKILVETALESYLAAQEAAQAAEEVVEESSSEPASEEEQAAGSSRGSR